MPVSTVKAQLLILPYIVIKPRELSGNVISIKNLAQHLQITDGYRYVNPHVQPQTL